MRGRLKPPIWILPLAIAMLVALFGWWGDIQLRRTLAKELNAKLTSTLDANVTALEIWTTNQTRLADSLAEEPEVRIPANRILDRAVQELQGASVPRPRRIFDLPDAEKLRSFLQQRLRQLGYEVAQLVDTNFFIVATTGRGRMGVGLPVSEAHTNRFAELFASGQPILIAPFRPELLVRRPFPPGRRGGGENRRPSPFGRRGSFRGRGTGDSQRLNRRLTEAWRRRRGDFKLMQVAAPVRDEGGVVRGALALVINPDREFTRIISVARSGESGETYAFDQTGLLISRSRFDAQLRKIGLLAPTNATSALNLRLHDPGGDLTRGYKPAGTNTAAEPLIHIVAEAVAGTNGVDVQPSRDYRGVPVVGASRWLPQLGFGVATQIDAAEAYRPLRVLQLIFVCLFLLLLLCATVLFIFSYANLTWRRRLTEAELKLKRLGQYTLEEKIGEGGMGVVYRARHALLRRDTAVKLLLPERADAAAVERFEREVCLTCQLTHPNTIQVYDYGRTPEGVFYYAMEFLQGLNLHQLVDRFGPQPEGRVVHLLAQVCESLAEAHGRGLIHRDIKPANVFLCERGGVPDRVKVLDFGLVREYAGDGGSGLAGDEEFAGTPSFMPPEAIGSSIRTDPRSDLYSVGALGYYLLTGHLVYETRLVAEIHHLQLTGKVTSLSRRTTNLVSPQMEALILRCLEKEPARRPQSAADLRTGLYASPLASAWTMEERLGWWTAFRTQSQQPGPGTGSGGASPVPTVTIDFQNRR